LDTVVSTLRRGFAARENFEHFFHSFNCDSGGAPILEQNGSKNGPA
jgi:hypothetical protein